MEKHELDELLEIVRGGPGAGGVARLGELLGALSFAECERLDTRSYSTGLAFTWHDLSPHTVAGWSASAWPLAACASFHWDGYVRAAAVDKLAGSTDPALLPFLLLRATDWVAAIAHRALGHARARIDAAHADGWIDAWPFLGRRLRGGTAVLRAPVLALLLSPEVRPNVLRALRSGRPASRRVLAALLERVDGPGATELLDLATRSGDHALVTRAVRRRLETLASSPSSDQERADVARDLYGRTRSTARALALATWFGTESPPDLGTTRAALLDPSAAVREVARFAVGRQGLGIDVLALALAATATGSTRARARAVGILAEVGERRAEVFRAFTALHHAPRVREAAYAVLDRLGVHLDDEALVDLLQLPNARMARAAGRLLHRRGMSPSALARVRDLADEADEEDGPELRRRLARALLRSLPVSRGRPN